jgi:hypothetical protein
MTIGVAPTQARDVLYIKLWAIARCHVRRTFIRRELAAEARRVAAKAGSQERNNQQVDLDQRAHALRLRVMS